MFIAPTDKFFHEIFFFLFLSSFLSCVSRWRRVNIRVDAVVPESGGRIEKKHIIVRDVSVCL